MDCANFTIFALVPVPNVLQQITHDNWNLLQKAEYYSAAMTDQLIYSMEVIILLMLLMVIFED